MRQVLCIYILIILGACSQHKEQAVSDHTESSYEMAPEEMVGMNENEPITYQHLAAQKLQDYFDLLLLKKQHPEFQADIDSQLQEFVEDEVFLGDSVRKVRISNVRNIGEIVQFNDSVQEIVLLFDIDDGAVVKADSIIARVYTKKIELENREVVSTKILFLKKY